MHCILENNHTYFHFKNYRIVSYHIFFFWFVICKFVNCSPYSLDLFKMWLDKKYLTGPNIVYNFLKEVLILFHHDLTSLQVMGPYFDITVTNIVNFLEISSLANGVFTSLADIIHSSSICLLTKFQLMFSV